MRFVPSNEFKTFATTLGVFTAIIVAWGMYTTITSAERDNSPTVEVNWSGDRPNP